ncbi:hypothetical protein WJX73_002290 [Symbiochloris irregularis]|uniref:uroporphyrinogen decarboxylase n=1 Tax=Symbiochloris irregularis TaxID=706552 RepID=A0AAW1NS22_9CHLO
MPGFFGEPCALHNTKAWGSKQYILNVWDRLPRQDPRAQRSRRGSLRALVQAQDPLLLRVARGEDAERVPVWLMRQAGRYMPEFRRYSDQYGFRHRSETADIAIELSLQPWRAFQPDGVIMFSDILTPLPALGIEFDVVPKKGPIIQQPLRSMEQIQELRPLEDPGQSLPFIHTILQALRQEVGSASTVLGFVGSPWTLAAYAVEGKSDKHCMKTKTMMFHNPRMLHALLKHLTEALVRYVCHQIDSGAQVVQIFDSWAHHLSPAQFQEFSLPYAEEIIQRVHAERPSTPLIFHANGGTGKLGQIGAHCSADVLGPSSASSVHGQYVASDTTHRKESLGFSDGAASTAQYDYQAPSSITAATELSALSALSSVVPDTYLSRSLHVLASPKAATVSSSVLYGILQSPGSQREAETAIQRAIYYDQCESLAGPQKLACQVDKAVVNVGALFVRRVEGRVSTEVDPRFAFNTDQIVARALNLTAQYKDMGVPQERTLMRIPGSWEGIQAAKILESKGISTHIILVYSFAQAAAAAQAGASVIQPNLGQLGDWFRRNPGAIRDPTGPRQDSGSLGLGDNPGLKLVERIYNYCHKHHPRTKVMVSGIRRKQDALALAGMDYLVVGDKVLSELGGTDTLQGYNDGFSASGPEQPGSTVEARLTPAKAAATQFASEDTEPLGEADFRDRLGQTGQELLDHGVRGLVADLGRFEDAFTKYVGSAE